MHNAIRSEKPTVAIIVINWNGRDDTAECLTSLYSDDYQNKKVIVIDNGSSDGSVCFFRDRFPEATVIEAGCNRGFTGGNNLGIRHAYQVGADYVYLLNNDTISEPTALSVLVDAARNNPGFGLLTPVIHYFDRPDGTWFSGSRMDLRRAEAVHDNSNRWSRDASPVEIPWASGCAMLIPVRLIMQLGGFDDRFFLNWEDVELSIRLSKLGYKIALIPAARIYHKVSRSLLQTGESGSYYYTRNLLLFLSIHCENSGIIVLREVLRHMWRAICRMLYGKQNSFARLQATTMGVIDFYCGRFGNVRENQRKRTVRNVVKQWVKTAIPAIFYCLKHIQRQQQFRHGHGGAEYRVKKILVRQNGLRILGGPFKGMTYGHSVRCSAYLAKLVGSYEEELHAVISKAIVKPYTHIIDVGCAEGYYAVGFALRMPHAKIIAYDTDQEARWFCAALARLNGVENRVELRELCDPMELQKAIGSSTFVICDCEGYEQELLDPVKVPGLAQTDILVELHEFVSRGITERVTSKFRETHKIFFMNTRERDVENYPVLKCVEAVDRIWAVREGRPETMQWAFMEAIAANENRHK